MQSLNPRAAVIRFHANDKHGIREATALANAGFDVDLIMLRGQGKPSPEVDKRVNLVLAPIRKKRGSALYYAWQFSLWFVYCSVHLARQHRKRRYTYVQVDSLPDHQVFCALIPKLFGAKVGLFLKEPTKELCESVTGSRLVGTIAGWVAMRCISFADLCFCVTEPHRQSYINRGVDPDSLHVVLNSTPPFPTRSRSRTKNDDGFVVVCHGTIEERYGHKTIVEAASIASKDIPGLAVRLPGKGTFAPALGTLIKQLGLDEVVTLDGWLSDEELAQLLADADVGVIAQLANPYSHLVHTLKMYDFMMAGVAVTASRLGATESLFPDEISYFESGDAADLARVWVELFNQPHRRQQQVQASKERLAELGWEVQMKKMVSAVSATLSNKPST